MKLLFGRSPLSYHRKISVCPRIYMHNIFSTFLRIISISLWSLAVQDLAVISLKENIYQLAAVRILISFIKSIIYVWLSLGIIHYVSSDLSDILSQLLIRHQIHIILHKIVLDDQQARYSHHQNKCCDYNSICYK